MNIGLYFNFNGINKGIKCLTRKKVCKMKASYLKTMIYSVYIPFLSNFVYFKGGGGSFYTSISLLLHFLATFLTIFCSLYLLHFLHLVFSLHSRFLTQYLIDRLGYPFLFVVFFPSSYISQHRSSRKKETVRISTFSTPHKNRLLFNTTNSYFHCHPFCHYSCTYTCYN